MSSVGSRVSSWREINDEAHGTGSAEDILERPIMKVKIVKESTEFTVAFDERINQAIVELQNRGNQIKDIHFGTYTDRYGGVHTLQPFAAISYWVNM